MIGVVATAETVRAVSGWTRLVVDPSSARRIRSRRQGRSRRHGVLTQEEGIWDEVPGSRVSASSVMELEPPASDEGQGHLTSQKRTGRLFSSCAKMCDFVPIKLRSTINRSRVARACLLRSAGDVSSG